MILEHYSQTPLLAVLDASHPEEPDHKPIGLWVSVPGDDDWPTWCRREDYNLGALACVTRFRLAPSANVLHIKTGMELDAFHDEFAPKGDVSHPSYRTMTIDWGAVAARYDGIVIAPYRWSHRLDRNTRWYYGWDCASGCVWNAKALEMISAMKEVV